ncbi:MAG: DNA cytosine methyltransferase [Alphaproteobacteria bacterium]|nr:DNA cytosine methyltransferase [Alphaproteobacteria bacterium]
MAPPRRVLELFAGIGGAARAVDGHATVVGAVDHDLRATAVYRANHAGRVHVKNLVSVKDDWLAAFDADLWWMSPPCAPHGIRGAQADVDDRRSAAFLRLLGAVRTVRPSWVALENVPWFQGSRAHGRLVETLDAAGYTWTEGTICPTELGVPAVRRRWYLVAGREGVTPWANPAPSPSAPGRALADHVGPWRDDLAVPDALLARFGDAMHVVDADGPDAVAACFTRAYGRSPVYVGSYLRQRGPRGPALRYFAPEEIAALYGFGTGFSFGDLPAAHAWKLIGNSVSVDAVRHVLTAAGLGDGPSA